MGSRVVSFSSLFVFFFFVVERLEWRRPGPYWRDSSLSTSGALSSEFSSRDLREALAPLLRGPCANTPRAPSIYTWWPSSVGEGAGLAELQTQVWLGTWGNSEGVPWGGANGGGFAVASLWVGGWRVEEGGRVPSASRLILCSRCWPGSEVASPGRCRRGVRNRRSPSRSAGSKRSLRSAAG